MKVDGIAEQDVPWQHMSWQQSLATAIRDPQELLRALDLEPTVACSPAAVAQFPLRVPRSFVGRMRPGAPHDPLLRQVLPLDEECRPVPGFAADPVGDGPSRRSAGLLHKYHGRALLIASGLCAVHCRYCFRRHYEYAAEPRTLAEWTPALDAIAGDETLAEVILSGGDPLLLSDRRLEELIERLDAIPHLCRLRIHSRLPIVLPNRVTDGLLAALTGSRLRVLLVVHSNHGAELVDDCADALRQLVRAGLVTLNQAVLLRGVNDTLADQQLLSERLIDLGVLPYYLHQLDRVQGAAHFEVPDATGRALVRELRKRVPGYAVPRFVREIAGEPHKSVLE